MPRYRQIIHSSPPPPPPPVRVASTRYRQIIHEPVVPPDAGAIARINAPPPEVPAPAIAPLGIQFINDRGLGLVDKALLDHNFALIQSGIAGGVPEAPQDSAAYGRLNAAWTQVLPLTGGTVTGPLSAPQYSTDGNTFTGSGNAIPPRLNLNQNLAGSISGQSYVNYLVVSGDSADATTGSNGGAFDLGIVHNVGAGAQGGRGNIWAQLNVGALGGSSEEMLGISAHVFGQAGANTNGAFLQALVSSAVLDTGCSVSSVGNEFDYTAYSGSSLSSKYGLLIALGTGDAVAGSGEDAGLIFSNANLSGQSPGMGRAIQIGNQAHGWPVNPTTGTVLGVATQTVNKGLGRSGHFVARTALAGIDLRPVNFTQNAGGVAFASPGFAVSGAGQVSISNATFGTDANGAIIDVPNQIVTAVAIAAGGGGGGGGAVNDYYVGDILTAGSGGQYRVTTVAAGAVTGVSMLVPGVAASPPANPVATSGASGAGCTLTLTWSAARNQLTLNPSGGTTLAANQFIANGPLVANGGALDLVGANGTYRTLQYFTGTTAAAGLRWQIRASGVAESGSNAGSNLEFVDFDDAGNGIAAVLTLTRATAAATFGADLAVVGSSYFHAVGFNGTGAIAKPTVTGSRGGNAALASLLTALAAYGLVTDSTSA